jgi:hypothetical protein
MSSQLKEPNINKTHNAKYFFSLSQLLLRSAAPRQSLKDRMESVQKGQ